MISRTDRADLARIDVTDDSLSAITVLGIKLNMRLLHIERYGVDWANSGTLRYPLRGGPWTNWDDSDTIILTDFVHRGLR